MENNIEAKAFAQRPEKDVLCLLVRCMDARLSGLQIHRRPVYEISNAGARFSPPNADDRAGSTQISYELFLGMGEEKKAHSILAFSGHYDCAAVKAIFGAHHKTLHKDDIKECGGEICAGGRRLSYLAPALRTLEREYGPLANLVNGKVDASGNGLQDKERINLLAKAKVLTNVNTALSHQRIAAAVASGRVSVVAYMKDPTIDPYRLLVFYPDENEFVPGDDKTLAVLSRFPQQEKRYAITEQVDIGRYLDRAVRSTRLFLGGRERQLELAL